MQSERLYNGSSVRLGDFGTTVLRFFGGLVSVIGATVLGTVVIGFGSYLILYLFGQAENYENVLTAFFSEYGVPLGAIAGTILGLAGLAWFSFRNRTWSLLWGGITAAVLGWAFVAYMMHEFAKAPI